ncbi:hypothetical protein KKG45_11070, partial [bacterium]|nr:hypothetical protein [bacterium]
MTETRRGGDGGGIRVAAVGHRDSADDGLAAAVRRVLATILGPDVDAQDVPHAVRGIIISSLAEGADRLLAREGLALPGVELHAVL